MLNEKWQYYLNNSWINESENIFVSLFLSSSFIYFLVNKAHKAILIDKNSSRIVLFIWIEEENGHSEQRQWNLSLWSHQCDRKKSFRLSTKLGSKMKVFESNQKSFNGELACISMWSFLFDLSFWLEAIGRFYGKGF